jgi:hypothetical protein
MYIHTVANKLEKMDLIKEISYRIELHSVQGIKDCFENGLNPSGSRHGTNLEPMAQPGKRLFVP